MPLAPDTWRLLLYGVPAVAAVSEAAEHRFNAFEDKRARRNACGGLEGATEKAGLARRGVLHLLVLRNSILWRRGVLRRHLLIGGGRSLLLRWLFVSLAKETAQETGGVRGLRTLLMQLLLKLADLSPCLIEGNVLDEHRLRKHVYGVRISGQTLVQQCFGIRVLFLK